MARGGGMRIAEDQDGLIRVDCWAGEDGSLVRVYERYGFSRVQEFTVALPAGPWPGMLLAMRLTSHPSQAALPAAGGRLRLGGQPDVFLPVQQAVQAGR